jgi:hypothetical protein
MRDRIDIHSSGGATAWGWSPCFSSPNNGATAGSEKSDGKP